MDNLAKHFNAILEKNLYLYTSLKQEIHISVLLLHASVLKLEHAWKSPGGLVKMQVADSTPGVSDSVGLGWDLRIEFLTSSQMIPMLLVQGPHFENHCYNRSLFSICCVLGPMLSTGNIKVKRADRTFVLLELIV